MKLRSTNNIMRGESELRQVSTELYSQLWAIVRSFFAFELNWRYLNSIFNAAHSHCLLHPLSLTPLASSAFKEEFSHEEWKSSFLKLYPFICPLRRQLTFGEVVPFISEEKVFYAFPKKQGCHLCWFHRTEDPLFLLHRHLCSSSVTLDRSKTFYDSLYQRV